MFRYLLILLMLALMMGLKNDNLCANYNYDEVIFAYVHEGRKPDLDFSKTFPNLKSITLYDNEYAPQYLGKNDSGLGKNVNLKEMKVMGFRSQNAVALSYLPNVEYCEIKYVAFHDLNYLSQALPALKTLKLDNTNNFFIKPPAPRERMAIIFENVSKLEFLENFIFNTTNHDYEIWGAYIFSDQEIEALSKMHYLKNFNIEIDHGNYCPTQNDLEFDKAKIAILKTLLPNTNIKVKIKCRAYQIEFRDDW